MGCCDAFRTENTEVGSWGIYPYDLLRKIWEYIMFILNVFTIWEIFFEWVFQMPVTVTWMIPAFIIDAFFVADMFIITRTGYIEDGMMILDEESIRAHIPKWRVIYGWIYPWPYYIIGYIVGNNYVYWSLMSLKILRLVRLYESYRLIRTHLVYISAKSKMFTLILFYLTLVHIFTCFAWLIGKLEVDRGISDSWFSEGALQGKGQWEQYFRMFYYTSTTVLTIGFGDIHPSTFPEMLYVIVMELVGIFNYHYIISNFVAIVTDPSRRAFLSRFKRVYRTFKWRNLPDESLTKMLRYYEYIWHRDRDREVFYDSARQLMPVGLQKRIRMAIHMSVFSQSPVLSEADEKTLEKIAICMHPRIFTPRDMLIKSGKQNKYMYFITQGRIQAFSRTGVLFDGGVDCVIGERSMILGIPEQCSWVAKTYVEAFELAKKDYDRVLAENPNLSRRARNEDIHNIA